MRYIRQKVVQLAAVLLLVTFLTFLLLNLLPGGPETAALGIGADEQAQAEFREEQNLDDPLIVRYVDWLGGLLSGDLGDSLIANVPVTDLLSQRLPVTLQLMVYATFLALIIAVPLGILTAYKADSMFDKSANTIAFGLLSLPNFIVGVLLVFLFSIRLGWLPATGSTPFGEDPAEHFRRKILPTIAQAVIASRCWFGRTLSKMGLTSQARPADPTAYTTMPATAHPRRTRYGFVYPKRRVSG